MKHKTILVITLVVSTVLLSGCTHSVDWYKKHPDEAKKEFDHCFNKMTPEEKSKNKDCQNAAKSVNGDYVFGLMPKGFKY